MRTGRYFLLFFCVVTGLGLVAWRAKVRAETARAIARVEARARGASLELQFSQASSAAEMFGALARQGRGGLTNFQRVATELLTAHPGLASLELQPGGVVSDIVPRAGHERAVGFNVLKDAGQRVGANEAIARRVLTVAGPVTLDHGEQGIVARVPVFQRTLDGRDSFWGFVAVSMRLQQALSQAQMDDLVRQGYNFAFFAPLPGQQKAVAIASHGLMSLQDTVQQPIRAQNLDFRLALKPRSGWIDKTKVVLESLAVLLISALVALLVNLLESRRAVEAELTKATQRLTREAADRDQAQADSSGAKEGMATLQADLKRTQLALQQAESKAAQFQARVDASDRARDETVQVHEAELKEAHAALQKAQETITQLEARLDAAARAEKDAASVAQKRLQQYQTTLAELQVRLETATRSTRETAEASVAKAAQLEQSNRELKARLLVAERAEARVTELNELLEKAREELRHRQEASTKSAGAASAQSGDTMPSETGEKGSGHQKLSAGISVQGSPALPPSVVEGDFGKTKEDRSGSISSGTAGSSELSTSGSALSLPREGANALPLLLLGAEEAPVAFASPSEPSTTHKAVKAPKRKKARRDDQLHLFGNEVSAVATTNQPAAEAEAQVVGSREPKIAAIETAVTSETPASDRPKTPTGQAESATSLQESSKRAGRQTQPTPEPETAEKEVQPTSSRTSREPSLRLPPAPPVDLAELRTAVSQILPLLSERDPGAKDCLRDNRKTFRSVFTAETYVEFEQLVKNGDFDAGLEQLKKAARKHGLSLI
jgi:sensor domain CHASE-containing protein